MTLSRAPEVLARPVAARGPFALESALRFLEGFAPATFEGAGPAYVGAHVLNARVVLLRLSAASDGRLHLGVEGPRVVSADLDAAERLARRMFSLDWDGVDFYERVGQADSVLGGLQRRLWGLRPVLFGSPFEALCWAVIGQRIRMSQAARLKARLAHALGPTVDVDGRAVRAFPAPSDLLGLPEGAEGLGLSALKLERLGALAERGERGDLDAERLLGMPPQAARAWLELSPGIGPWASEFALIRGAGHSDVVPSGDPRLCVSIRRSYGLAEGPTREEVEQLAARWAPHRSWAVFLLRVALEQGQEGDTDVLRRTQQGASGSRVS